MRANYSYTLIVLSRIFAGRILLDRELKFVFLVASQSPWVLADVSGWNGVFLDLEDRGHCR